MGGYGSGRPASCHPTTDGLLFLDVRFLRRAGYLRPSPASSWYTLSWSRGGHPNGTITLIVPRTEASYPDHVLLSYRTQAPGQADWTEVSERVAIETTPCHYGGERPWLACPRCGSRRAVLFSVGGYFRCRACHRVVYASTRETEDDRVTRRAGTLQRRLGGHQYGSVFDAGPKPTGMHRATYRRICDELEDLDIASMQAFLARFGKYRSSTCCARSMRRRRRSTTW